MQNNASTVCHFRPSQKLTVCRFVSPNMCGTEMKYKTVVDKTLSFVVCFESFLYVFLYKMFKAFHVCFQFIIIYE